MQIVTGRRGKVRVMTTLERHIFDKIEKGKSNEMPSGYVDNKIKYALTTLRQKGFIKNEGGRQYPKYVAISRAPKPDVLRSLADEPIRPEEKILEKVWRLLEEDGSWDSGFFLGDKLYGPELFVAFPEGCNYEIIVKEYKEIK